MNGLVLDLDRLDRLHPELSFGNGLWNDLRALWLGAERDYWLERIQHQLDHGEPSPAHVVSLEPFYVAAYAEEFDCVVPLEFPRSLARGLQVGDPLLTLNTYTPKHERVATDLRWGERGKTSPWGDVAPLIAELVCDVPRDLARSAERERCAQLARELFAGDVVYVRDGRPRWVDRPGRYTVRPLGEQPAAYRT